MKKALTRRSICEMLNRLNLYSIDMQSSRHLEVTCLAQGAHQHMNGGNWNQTYYCIHSCSLPQRLTYIAYNGWIWARCLHFEKQRKTGGATGIGLAGSGEEPVDNCLQSYFFLVITFGDVITWETWKFNAFNCHSYSS